MVNATTIDCLRLTNIISTYYVLSSVECETREMIAQELAHFTQFAI